MDSSDPIIREIDVYLVDNDVDLYLIQFPLKPVYADPPTDIRSIRFKPQHKKFELEIPYPESIFENENEFSIRQFSAEDRIQKFQSSHIKQTSSLGLGVVKENVLHVTAIEGVLQMRPSFHNLKAFDEIIEEDLDEQPKEDVSKLQKVQLKRKESEKAQSTRLQSYGYLNQQEENEPWITLRNNDMDSEACNEIIEGLYCQPTN